MQVGEGGSNSFAEKMRCELEAGDKSVLEGCGLWEQGCAEAIRSATILSLIYSPYEDSTDGAIGHRVDSQGGDKLYLELVVPSIVRVKRYSDIPMCMPCV